MPAQIHRDPVRLLVPNRGDDPFQRGERTHPAAQAAGGCHCIQQGLNILQVFHDTPKWALDEALDGKDVEIRLKSVGSETGEAHWYTKQIIKYASSHGYYFNRSLPRYWFRFNFTIAKETRYDLIVTVHHSSYEDSVMAVGAFLELFDEKAFGEIEGEERNHMDYTSSIPIEMEPYKISLQAITDKLLQNIESYIRDVVKIGLTVITSDIV